MDMTLDKSPAAQSSVAIDKEHQVQIGMLDALCTLIGEDESQPRINEMLKQLASYSEVHFMSEQLLMRMYAYPDYDDHVQDHEAMIEHLNQIQMRFESGENIKALETADEMKKFLLGHIKSRDQSFTDFLANMQNTK